MLKVLSTRIVKGMYMHNFTEIDFLVKIITATVSAYEDKSKIQYVV